MAENQATELAKAAAEPTNIAAEAKPPWKRILVLTALTMLPAALLVDYLLALAGIEWIPIQCFRVPKVPESAVGQVITAAVAVIGAAVGLWTFFFNTWEKQDALEKTTRTQREIAEAERQQNREFETAREDRERQLARLDQLEKQFDQLAEDFAAPGALERINAAIGLAELAVTPSPVNLPASDGNPKTQDHYPYFMRAANRLAAALHQWTDFPARQEALKALDGIGKFAKCVGTDEPLLCDLVNSLADANRTALAVFSDAIAQHHALLGQPDPDMLETLVRREFRRETLDQMITETFNSTNSYKIVSLPETDENNRQSLVMIQERAAQLASARRALIAAVRTLSTRHENRLMLGLKDVFLSEAILTSANLVEADLIGANLQMAKLFRANLAFADLSGADLQRAVLSNAMLEGANLSWANLSRAHLEGADLKHATLENVDLRNANLTRTNLKSATLKGTILTDANLTASRLTLADLTAADLSGTDLTRTNLVEAQLIGARLFVKKFDGADFTGANWWEADWLVREDAGEDTQAMATAMRAWLEENFPRPT